MSTTAGTQLDRKLRLMTYLSPGAIPLGLLDLLRDLLESELGVEVYIIYESRWSGPPPGRADPFSTDDADIALMCSTAYLRMVQDQNKHFELCHAAPVHDHQQNNGRPFYFSEVIIHSSNQKKFKDFHALKGCRWAYNDDLSLSGSLVVLAELKKLGFNASFFGDVIKSGSHLKSLDMIIDHQVEAAAIDSTVVVNYKRQYPERADKLKTLTSFGPLPIQPIVFNKKLPAPLKEQITKALLAMHTKSEWMHRLQSFGVTKFTQIDESLYELEHEINELVKGLTIAPAYY
ncbi:hypothetical protein BaRGS_00038804 [Batillaria attramentaria]|uniref:Uncharacterized protein n=1 Tax=Batillaria attramentaria TaxID=370345 RepID=A0ABD0J4V0_9CAEN